MNVSAVEACGEGSQVAASKGKNWMGVIQHNYSFSRHLVT